jgi:predicted nucleic acid-binding protein
VIAYFDTSAIVPLLVDEPTTDLSVRLWNESTRVVSARLFHPEARAALARAQRLGRLTRGQLSEAVAELDALADEVDIVELSADVACSAGELAEQHALRGYDAVHLAAALAVADDDVVLVSGDGELAAAARAAGLVVAAA